MLGRSASPHSPKRSPPELGGRVVTLDDATTREAAQADPVAFLEQNPDGLLTVDEVQRVPELIVALKLAVDRDRRPGRFLLTGSANLTKLTTVEDSLAGRIEHLELHGLSQGEISGHREQFIDRLLAGDLDVSASSALARGDYLRRAIAGGYPEALQRPEGRRRDRWLDSYVSLIVERDAPDISGLQRIRDLPLVLRVIAAQNASELNVAGLAGVTGIPASSLGPLLDLLDTLYLTQRVPAWSTNLTGRVVSRPKVALLDTGLAARLVNVSADGAGLTASPQVAGQLLEGFVAGELRRQLGWSDEAPRISHFRDRNGDEVDLVLETPDGRIAGVEVKATAMVDRNDVRSLVKMRDRLGDRFVAGVVLYSGRESAPFGDRIIALPLDTLWTA